MIPCGCTMPDWDGEPHDDGPVCECGHLFDEHDDSGVCQGYVEA